MTDSPPRPLPRSRGLIRLGNLFLAALRAPAVPRRAHPRDAGSGRRAPRRSASAALLRAPGPAAVEPPRAGGGGAAPGLALGAGADRPRVPGRRARGVLGDPQSQSAEHAHDGAVGHARADDRGAVARSCARHAARPGDGAVGAIAGIAGFAPEGAVRRRVGERGSAAAAADHLPARPADARHVRRADLAPPADRRRGRRSHGGAQGQSLPALLFSPDARSRRSDPTCRTGAT